MHKPAAARDTTNTRALESLAVNMCLGDAGLRFRAAWQRIDGRISLGGGISPRRTRQVLVRVPVCPDVFHRVVWQSHGEFSPTMTGPLCI